MHIDTRAVHAGRAPDASTGAVMPPIHLSTTFERAADGSYPTGFAYIRESSPNRAALETALADLEGGQAAFAFSSGMAAIDAALRTLNPGEHVIFPDEIYYGVRSLLAQVYPAGQIAYDFVDMTSPDAVRNAIRPNTRLVWMETPSNPSLKVADIAAIAAIVHDAGAWCAVDNTWATPVLQNPLALGADMVMHSTTKYIGGHSDVLGGALVVRESGALAEKLAHIQHHGGAVPAPFDCWLLLRSMATLPLRARAQSETAGRIAAFLAGHPAVARVHYPGLETHPGHTVAARQMRAFGGMLSFEMGGGREAAFTLAAGLKLITRATSLGGVESLIEHRRSIEGPASATPDSLLRMSAGLEHADDLIADLDAALSAT
jgi:cystathionine gamma-synthase